MARPTTLAGSSSLRGLYATPLSLVEEGRWTDGSSLFLTPGILTVPVLALLVFKVRQRLSAAILVLLSCFFFLSFPPFDIWQILPQFTWGLQFPYRLLAFVSLFVAIGLMLIFPKMNWPACSAIVAVLIWQNFRLLSVSPLPDPLGFDQSKIADTFSNLDYFVCFPTFTVRSRWNLAEFRAAPYPRLHGRYIGRPPFKQQFLNPKATHQSASSPKLCSHPRQQYR